VKSIAAAYNSPIKAVDAASGARVRAELKGRQSAVGLFFRMDISCASEA
jgi:hypothetical protein